MTPFLNDGSFFHNETVTGAPMAEGSLIFPSLSSRSGREKCNVHEFWKALLCCYALFLGPKIKTIIKQAS